MLRAWMQEYTPPAPHHQDWPGRWVAEPCWPPAGGGPAGRGASTSWPAGTASCRTAPVTATVRGHRGEETGGLDAGALTADGGSGDWPGDQRGEDGRSLSFTSGPLGEAVEILGNPWVSLTAVSDQPGSERGGPAVRCRAHGGIAARHARPVQSHAPGRPRPCRAPGARPGRARGAAAEGHRAPFRGRSPDPALGLDHVLALDVAPSPTRNAGPVLRREFLSWNSRCGARERRTTPWRLSGRRSGRRASRPKCCPGGQPSGSSGTTWSMGPPR